MYQLEERILFDGAAAVDLAVAQQEQQAQDTQAQTQPQSEAVVAGDQPQVQNPHETAPVIPADTASAVPTSDTASTDTTTAALSAPIDASNPSQTTADTHHVNVLVVSDSIENADELFKSANSETVVVRYSEKNTTGAELLQEITDALHGEKADSIGFVTDKAHDGTLKIFSDSDTSTQSLSTETQQKFWNGVEGLLAEKGKVNIFASDLASTETGRHLVDSLSQITNHQVAASTDVTGDGDAGGDWELEYVAKGTGSVDLIEEYFNRDAIQSFDHRIEKPTEIAFVDSSVRDVDTILKGIGDQAEIVYLNKDHAFEQITSYLQGRTDVDAVHLVSDGTSGEFYLGNETINSDFIASHQTELAAWGNAMSADGDIHIYSCDLAKDQVGQDLVNQISIITGTDVAASVDRTGVAGDWNLEFTSGEIQTAGFVIGDYIYNLKIITVKRLDDFLIPNNALGINEANLTLREAVYIAANGDNIVFADYGVLHSITSTTPDPTYATTGAIYSSNIYYFDDTGNRWEGLIDTLTIRTNITIDGNIVTTYPTSTVNNSVILDAGERALHEPGKTFRGIYIDSQANADGTGVSLNNMIIKKGLSLLTDTTPAAGSGGGIYVSSISSLSLQTLPVPTGGTRVTVQGSTATYGGGIFNAGILNLSGSVTLNNASYGGGVFNAGTMNGTGTGSVDGNTATDHGGGIYNDGILNLAGSGPSSPFSVDSNRATNGNGGGIYSNTGDISLTNADISSNHADAGNGGGIYIFSNYEQSAPMHFTRIDVSGNSAIDGAGIYLTNASSTSTAINVFELEWSDVTGNTATGNGGGIALFNNAGNIAIQTVFGTTSSYNLQSNISFNDAVNGAGVYIENCANVTMDFIKMTFNGNTAIIPGIPITVNGGAIYVKDSGTITLTDMEITYNYASSLGGGIYYTNSNTTGSLNVQRSNISENDALSGGGIYQANGTLVLINDTLAFNGNAVGTGGAIYMDYGTLNVSLSTIAYNEGIGAAIYIHGNDAGKSNLTVGNTIIYNLDSNLFDSQIYLPAYNADLTLSQRGTISFSTTTNLYSHYGVDKAYPVGVNAGVNSLADVLGNRDASLTVADRLFGGIKFSAKSQAIEQNLYLDDTLMYAANYRTMALAILSQNSWAIGGGSGGNTYDQRGNARGTTWTWNQTTQAWTKGSGYTIGAFEPIFHTEVNSNGDDSQLWYTGDPNAHYFDLASGGSGLTLREAIYWIDTRAALDFNSSNYYEDPTSLVPQTYLQYMTPNTPKPPNNFTIDDYDSRYVGFNSAYFAVPVGSTNPNNTIQLNFGQIEIGGRWNNWDSTNTNRDLAVGYMIRTPGTSGNIDHHDNTLREKFTDPNTFTNNPNRITVLAGDSGNTGAVNRLFMNTSGSVLALNNLTISGGIGEVDPTQNSSTTNGGGIWNQGNLTLTNMVVQNSTSSGGATPIPGVGGKGGGIYNIGTAYIYDSSILNNTATAVASATVKSPDAGQGGGIWNSGTMIIDRSQINENTAGNKLNPDGTIQQSSSDTGNAMLGGGIYNAATLTIERSEISGNTVNGLTLAQNAIKGAGIYNLVGGILNIANSTIAENTLDTTGVKIDYSKLGVSPYVWGSYGSGVYNDGKVVSYYNTIVNNKALVTDTTTFPVDPVTLKPAMLDELAAFYNNSNTGTVNSSGGFNVLGAVNTDFTYAINTGFTGNINTDFTGNINTDFTVNVNTDFTVDVNTDFAVDVNTDFTGSINTDFTINVNNNFTGAASAGYLAGSTDTISVKNFSGVFLTGSNIAIGTDFYRVVSSSGGETPTSITLDRVLVNDVLVDDFIISNGYATGTTVLTVNNYFGTTPITIGNNVNINGNLYEIAGIGGAAVAPTSITIKSGLLTNVSGVALISDAGYAAGVTKISVDGFIGTGILSDITAGNNIRIGGNLYTISTIEGGANPTSITLSSGLLGDVGDNAIISGAGYAAGVTKISVDNYTGTAPVYIGSNITIGLDPTLYEVTAVDNEANPTSITLKTGIVSAVNDNDTATGAGYAAGVTVIRVDGWGANAIPIQHGSNITIAGTLYTVDTANDSFDPTSITLTAALGSAVAENAIISGAGYAGGAVVTQISVDGWVDSLGNLNTVPIAHGSNITIAGTLYTVDTVDSGTPANPKLITLSAALGSAVAENAAIAGAGYDTGVTTISVDGLVGLIPLAGSYIRVAGDLNLHEVVTANATSITLTTGLTNPIVDNAVITGAGYATGTSSIRVDGFNGGVVAGNWVTIDGETDGSGNLIMHQLAALSSSTRLYFTDTLTNDIADKAVVTRVLAPNLTSISVTGFNGTIEAGTYITIAGDIDPISGNLVLHKVNTYDGITITFDTATSNPVAVNAEVVAGRSLSLSNSILAENRAILTTGGREIWQRSDIYVRAGGGILVDGSGVGNDHNIIGAFNFLSKEVTYTYKTTVPAPGTNTPVYYERTWNSGTGTWNTPVPIYEFVPSSTTTNTGYDWTDNVTNIVGYIPPAIASLPVAPTYIGIKVMATAADLPADLKLSPYAPLATPFIYTQEKDSGGVYINKWFRIDASGNHVSFDPSKGDGLYTSSGAVFGSFNYANGLYQTDTYTASDPTTPVIIINPGGTTTDVTNPRYGIVADLKLDFALNYNGALTRTLRVLDGSVAKDNGIIVARPVGRFSDATFFTDQRGASRGTYNPDPFALPTPTNIGAFDYVDTITVSSGADSATPRVGFDFVNYRPLWDSTTLTLREAVKLADDGSHIIFKDTWQKNGTVYVDPTLLLDGKIDNGSGYAIGTTTVNVKDFSRTVAVGSYIQIEGDPNYHKVTSTTATSITFSTALVNAVLDGANINDYNAVTVANELNSSGNLIINLVGGELPVTRSVTINGIFDWNEVNSSGTVTTNHYDSIAQLTANANNRLFNLKTAMSTVGISNFIMTGTGNVTGNGAGIFSSANLWLDNVTIQNCKAVARTATSGDGLGGGIYSDQGYLQMINSTIGSYTTTGGNTAAFGGGIYVSGRNSASNVVLDIGHMIVDGVDSFGGSSIVGNTANNATNGSGGGVYLLAGNANVIYSTIGNNKTVSDGGGIFVATTGGLAMTNSTVANNTAGRHGGGIAFNSYNTLNLDYTTIANNQAGWNITGSASGNPFSTGGGIYMNSGTLALSNSILAQNFAGKFSPTTTLIQSKTLPVTVNSTNLNLGIHDDLYTYARTNTITNSVYGATGGAGAIADPPPASDTWIKTADDWTAFYSVSGTTVTAKLDTKLTDNGGHSKTVYVFDPLYFKRAVGGVLYDQTQLEEFTDRITSGAYENSVDKFLYYVDGEITKGRDRGSNWISANGVVLSEADGVLNANNTIFVFDDTHMDPLLPTPGKATLNYNWTINGPDWTKTYRSHIALMNNAYFTVAAFVQGTTTPTILDGQIVLNDDNPVLPSHTAETATLELQTSSLNDSISSASRNTMLSVNPGASATSNTTVIYNSTSSTQRVLAVDAIYGGAMEYDNLTLSGAAGTTLSYKNAWGSINVNKLFNVGSAADNVKLTVLNTAGGGNADLNILGSTLSNFGQIVAASISIDGTTITGGGIINATQNFDMTNVTYTDAVNAKITPTLAKITAGIDLTMTNVSITGLTSPVTLFTATGDVYFNGGTIDLTNVSIAAGSGKNIYMGYDDNSNPLITPNTLINLNGNVTLSGPSNGKTVTVIMGYNDVDIVASTGSNIIYSNGLNVSHWAPGGSISTTGSLKIDISAQNLTVTNSTTNNTPPSGTIPQLNLGLDRLTIAPTGYFGVITSGTVISTANPGPNLAAIQGTLALSGKIALNNSFANFGVASSTLELGGTIVISTPIITMANSLSLMGITTVNTAVGFVPTNTPMSITSSSGNLSIGTVGTFTGNTNNLDLNAAGNVTIGNVTGIKMLTVVAGNNFTLTNSITAPGDVAITAGGIISAGGKTLTATGAVTFNGPVNLQNIIVIAGSAKNILFNGDLSLTGNTTIGSIASNVKFTNTNVTVTGLSNNIVTKALDVSTWQDPNPLILKTINVNGALNINISTQALVLTPATTTSTATTLTLGLDRLAVSANNRLAFVTTNTTNSITATGTSLNIHGTLALNGKIDINPTNFMIALPADGTLEFGGTITIRKNSAVDANATISMPNSIVFASNVTVDPLVTGTTTITSTGGSITVGSNQTTGAKFTGSGKGLVLDAAGDITLGNVLGINNLIVICGDTNQDQTPNVSKNIFLNNSITVTGTSALIPGNVEFKTFDSAVQLQNAYTSSAMTTLSPIVITAGTTFGTIKSPGFTSVALLPIGNSELQLTAGNNALSSSDIGTVSMNNSLTFIKGGFASGNITLTGNGSNLIVKAPLYVNGDINITGNGKLENSASITGAVNTSPTGAVNGAYLAGRDSMVVDGFTGSPLQVGSTFKITGETGTPTHTVLTTSGGLTPTITFTTNLVSNVADNAVITATGYAPTPAGTITINVDGFNGVIASGSYITITGDPNSHKVTGTTTTAGATTSITLDVTTPLSATVADNAIITASGLAVTVDISLAGGTTTSLLNNFSTGTISAGSISLGDPLSPLSFTGTVNNLGVTGSTGAVNGGYASGITNINVAGFNSAIAVGSCITIEGDTDVGGNLVLHKVVSTVGGATPTSITFSTPLANAIVNNADIHVLNAINNSAGYVAGTTTVNVGFNGAIANGSYITIAGDTDVGGNLVLHKVVSTVGGATPTSITFSTALTNTIGNNAEIKVLNVVNRGYNIGDTTLSVALNDAIAVGSYVSFAGDPTYYKVASTVGGAIPTSITLSSGLTSAMLINAPITRCVSPGVTSISVTDFSSIQVGSFITIAGDAYPHRVMSIVGGNTPTSIVLSEGLTSAVLPNAVITGYAPPASLVNAGAVNVTGDVKLFGGNLTNSMRFTAGSIANTFGGDLTNSNFGNITNSGTGVTGGMVVTNNITLVSTGFLNNTGTISATGYNLVKGTLTTSSSLKADTITFNGTGNLVTSGTVAEKTVGNGIDITLNGGSFTNTGTMTSVDVLDLKLNSTLNNNAGTLTANLVKVATGTLSNKATLNTDAITFSSTGNLENTLILAKKTPAGAGVVITLAGGNFTNTGTMTTVDALTLTGSGTLNNNAGTLTVNTINMAAGALNNNGTLTANTTLTMATGALNNNAGTLTANALTMTTGTLTNKATLAAPNITVGGNLINSSILKGLGTNGLVNINLNAGGSLTNTGTMAFVNALTLTGAGALNNNTGTLTANTIDMFNGTLTNKAILNVYNGVTGIHITGTGDLANTGTLKANVITLENGNLTNSTYGTIAEIAGGAVYITPTGAVNTSNITGKVDGIYGSGETNINVDSFTGSPLQVGSTFKIAGETGTPTHAVTNIVGATIYFTTPLAPNVADNAVITATGYATTTTTINVDGFTGSNLQVGSTFKITGETGAPIHTVTGIAGSSITFTSALASPVLDNAVITATGYAATTTRTINVSGFTSAITDGSSITIAGDLNLYVVQTTTGGATPTSITFTTPLVNAVVSNSVVVSTVSTITLNGTGKTLTNNGYYSIKIDNLVLNGSNLDSSSTLNISDKFTLMGAGTRNIKTSATALATTAGTLDLQSDAIMSQGRLTVTNFNFNKPGSDIYFQMNNSTAVTTLEITGNYVFDVSGLTRCSGPLDPRGLHYFVTAGTSKVWIRPLANTMQTVWLTDVANKPLTNPVINIDVTGSAIPPILDKLVGLSTFKPVTINGQYNGIPASSITLNSAVNRVWNVTRTSGDTAALTFTFHWNTGTEAGSRLNDNAKLFYSSGTSWGSSYAGTLDRPAGTFRFTTSTAYPSSGSYSISNYPIMAMNDDSSSIGAQLEELKEQFIDAIFGTKEAIIEPQMLAEAQERSAMETMFSQMANRGNLMERNKLFKTDIDLGLEELLAV